MSESSRADRVRSALASKRRVADVAGWAICDGSARYIHRVWPTRREAIEELRMLVRVYPRGHEWRRRLTVGWWDGRAVVAREVVP